MEGLIGLLVLGWCLWMIIRHPLKITITHIQDWVSSDVGIRCVSSPLLLCTDYLRKRPPPLKLETES